MASSVEMRNGRSGWRIAMWGGAAGLLLVPALAMQLTPEVDWGREDFITMGVMLTLACAAFELTMRATRSPARRAAGGVAILGAFLLVWAELAVGIFP